MELESTNVRAGEFCFGTRGENMDLKYRTSHDLNYDRPYLVLLVSFVDVGLVYRLD